MRPLKFKCISPELIHFKKRTNNNKEDIAIQIRGILNKQSKCQSPDITRKRRSIFSYSPLYRIKETSGIKRNCTFDDTKNNSTLRFNQENLTLHNVHDHSHNILTNEAIFEKMRLLSCSNKEEAAFRDRAFSNPCVKKRVFTYKQPDPIKPYDNMVVTELLLDKFNSHSKRKKAPKRRIVYPSNNLKLQLKPQIIKLLAL